MKNNAITQAKKVISYRTIRFFTPSPSVLHPKAQRRRQTVEHLHQAVERRHALPQADPRRPEEAP